MVAPTTRPGVSKGRLDAAGFKLVEREIEIPQFAVTAGGIGFYGDAPTARQDLPSLLPADAVLEDVISRYNTLISRLEASTLFGPAEAQPDVPIDLQPNTDEVLCCPWAAGLISTAASNVQTGRDYLNDYHRSRIRQKGTIKQIVLRVDNVPTTSLKFKVWRLNGSGTFDLIGDSGDIKGLVTADTTVTVTLPTPIANVEEGDFYGVYSAGGSGVFTAQTGITGATLRYFTGEAANPADFRGAGTAAASIPIPVEIMMEDAPSIVHIGDSRVAGHPTHYTHLETTANFAPADTIAYKLRLLNLVQYQNMGIGSQTSANIASRVAADVVAMKPRVCVLEIGVNDVSGGVTIETYEANIDTILAALKTAGIKVIICSIGPWHGSNNSQAALIDQFNALLLGKANADSTFRFANYVPLVGEFRSGGDPGNLWNVQAAYRADNVHFNAAGNALIAQAIHDAIEA